MEVTNREKGRGKEKRVRKKERIVGKKESYREGEKVCLQDIKTKLWNLEGVVVKVRTSDDGTIVSYDIDVNGVITTGHGKYMSKIKNADDETEDSGNIGGENTTGAESRASSQQ